MTDASIDVHAEALGAPAERAWWADAVGYEVYLRSFADGDGDGIGDLPGLTARLDHLADLGVDIVWVTPFYPSPMADYGYDVADYCDVDPRFGTLADLDELVEGVHRRGMRLIIDLVPNHTSDQHPWFQAALADPGDPHRDWYLFRDPGPDGGPPNNWRSHFGGPAWTLDEASGQWWCHLFLPEQPDLDWSNPAVRREFESVLRFWLDRGVDGFRIDVAHSLTKDAALRDNPVLVELPADASPRALFQAMRHDHDLDQPGTLDVYRSWRTIADAHDAVLLGEVYLDDPAAVGRYVGDGLLDLSFYFPVLHATWRADELASVVHHSLEHGRGRFSWVHSSHDDPRAPTRFGGGAVGRSRATSFIAFTALLPGPLFLYQGDELGLEDGHVDPSQAHDPVAVRNADASDGRDPVRTPIPWEPDRPNLGFSTGTPWLPVGQNHGPADTVAVQAADPASPLRTVRRLLATRRALLPSLPHDVTWLDAGPDRLAFRRGPITVVLDVDSSAGPLPLADLGIDPGASVAFEHGGARLDGAVLHLPADAVVVLERG